MNSRQEGLAAQNARWGFVRLVGATMLLAVVASATMSAHQVMAQDTTPKEDVPKAPPEEAPKAPEKVSVQPVSGDDQIAQRLQRILVATDWFQEPYVDVDEGVVFLEGATASDEYRQWAETLAANTEDVVAVVNHIEVMDKPLLDLSPAISELRELGENTIRVLPLIAIALVLLILSWFAAKLAARTSQRALRSQLRNDLLRRVVANAIAIPVFLLGLYLVLKVSGLTRLAMTVIGGTGLAGLIIGIAFRDIAENFLASILLSVQRPFQGGDLIEVAGKKGFVQRVTTRGTLLMTLEGNHIHIPNSTIYKEALQNFSSCPNVRQDFLVGIGYDSSIADAQEIAMKIIREHPAVLSTPEPLVLVEQLSAATIDLRIFFWVNGHEHSAPKVKSSIIRLIKQAYDEQGISMPDSAREIVFTRPLDIQMHRAGRGERQLADRAEAPPRMESPRLDSGEPVSTEAEGGFGTESHEIKQQARQSRVPDSGVNLLEDNGHAENGRPQELAGNESKSSS